jgi:F0F1-type ATP synthase membrane subunit c/vacuolar-type H+-ATPase subunit K
MEAEAAKLIGAGLAAIGAGLAAGGVGNVFGSFHCATRRLPTANRAVSSSASRLRNFWVCSRSSWR